MYLEFPAVWRYFRDYIEASGGIFELKKALEWSVWYAAKWWQEIYAAGVANLKKPFVKALYLSLRAKGLVDEGGKLVKEVKKPELPKGLYAREWVEMHQQFDELGAVRVARDEVDRNALDILFSDIQTMGWHRIMVKAFLKACGASDGRAVLEPYSREGNLAQLYLEDYKPAVYLGYDPSPSLVEVARQVAPGATFVAAPTACQLSGQFDLVLLVEKLHLMADPLRELDCIAKVLKPGGALYVAQPNADSMPGYLAILSAIGAQQVYTWKEVENLLSMRFKLEKRLIKTMPFYGAIYVKPHSAEVRR
jgi:Methylase involved in ubiquinone/menaquinone biosynthesis